MLNRQINRGFSLIELVVGMAIVGIVMAIAIPSFQSWSQNMQIRNAAQSIQNGLQYARTEALKRNTSVRFQLTTTVDNTCALSSTNTNWVVNLGDGTTNDPTGKCGTAISPNVTAYTTAYKPYLLQIYSAASTPNAVASMTSDAKSFVVFNSLGQVTWPTTGACSTAAGTATTGTVVCVDITNPTGGTCASASPSGPMTCMRVEVSLPAGQVRMCNPNAAAGSPQGC